MCTNKQTHTILLMTCHIYVPVRSHRAKEPKSSHSARLAHRCDLRRTGRRTVHPPMKLQTAAKYVAHINNNLVIMFGFKAVPKSAMYGSLILLSDRCGQQHMLVDLNLENTAVWNFRHWHSCHTWASNRCFIGPHVWPTWSQHFGYTRPPPM